MISRVDTLYNFKYLVFNNNKIFETHKETNFGPYTDQNQSIKTVHNEAQELDLLDKYL